MTKKKSTKSTSPTAAQPSSTACLHVADGLYLVRQAVPATTAPVAVPTATNHVAVIDVSGSMSYDLPKIREQLKHKLPKLLREGDTISIVWFSGRGQFGTLLEAEPVATLADLQAVNTAIDRWLRPVGMTGFREPLEEVVALVNRVGKKNNAPWALFFMSDGCDNQWPRADVLKAVEAAAGKLASTTLVEYGYYADRALLAAMASKAGGAHIFAEDFDSYAPAFEAAVQKRSLSVKRVEVTTPGDPIGGFAYALADGEIVTYEASSGKVAVPEGTEAVYYLAPTAPASAGAIPWTNAAAPVAGDAAALYAALSLFAVRMQPQVVYPVLKHLGDVCLINMFSLCFGKQKYSEFTQAAKLAAFDKKYRYQEGYDQNAVPRDDAFTVLDLLEMLASDEGNRVLLDDPTFKYSRVSRARVAAEDENGVVNSLKFTVDPKAATAGYSVASLTYNEDRPNISILVRKPGTVNLGGLVPTEFKSAIPEQFPTFIWRNYCIVKDGLVNVDTLPCKLTADTRRKLEEADVQLAVSLTGEPAISLKPLPIINRKMVTAASAKTLFELQYKLTQVRATQKVFNSLQKERYPRVAAKLEAQYGEAAAAWLRTQGITDNGFSPPHTTQVEATDAYVGRELKVSLKGLSTLPSLKEAREKLEKAKGKALTNGAAMMAASITEADAWLKANPEKLHEGWLDGKARVAQLEARGLIAQQARQKFAIVVGQIWPSEFKSLDENTLTIQAGGQDVVGKLEMREVEIKL